MATTRYVRVAIGAVAAGASLGPQNVKTPDDWRQRRVTGLFNTNNTKLVATRLNVNGQTVVEIDNNMFNSAAGFLPCGEVFAAGLQFQIDEVNNSAGGTPAATDEIVIRYEVPDAQVQPTAGPS